MSDLNPEIAQLIEAGRQRLTAERTEREARADAEKAKRQAEIDQQISGLHAAVMALLPESLHQYCGLVCDDSEPLNGWQYALLQVPGCSPITITIEVTRYWTTTNGKNVLKTDYTPIKRDTHPLFQVTRYQLAFDDDNGVYLVTTHTERPNDTHYGSDEIEVALAAAAEWFGKYSGLEEQAKAKTEEVQDKRALRQAKASAVANRNTAEREALLDQLADDPVLLALLKVAIALKQERAGYTESIEHLHEALQSQSEHHGRELDAKQQEAALALRNALNDADRAQRAADDLDSQLTRLKREARYA